MAFSSFPNVFSWIQSHQWPYTNTSINLCPTSNPSLKLSIKTNPTNSHYFSLSIYVDYNLPISLWTSKKIPLKPTSNTDTHQDQNFARTLLSNIVQAILKYSSRKIPNSSFKLPRTTTHFANLEAPFNFSFLTLSFVVCVYEAPKHIRASCLEFLGARLAWPESREASKALMRLLGSNAEETWMRSMNLAITNWVYGLRASSVVLKSPSPLFSCSFSNYGLWKVQLYCPVIMMDVEKSSGGPTSSPDEALGFSLNYHQVEGVIQLNYKVAAREKWIEVMVNTDNIRCDVVKLLKNTLLNERGAGASEKHFPSRISLRVTPRTIQSDIISVSVSKSSENHPVEIGLEKGLEASFEPPAAIGLHFSAGETLTTSLKPWKFEQSVHGNTANLNWYLHDSVDGREVFSSKPSVIALLHPRAWFKNRYSSAHRPFTRQGGVIFARDEYGESVTWKIDRGCCVGGGGGGGVMEWEIKGWIWLTYWPNKHRTLYTETRRLEFNEVVHLTLA